MKYHIHYRLMMMSLIIGIPLWGAQESKPSTWQKMKSFFGQSAEQKALNTLDSEQQKGFLESLRGLKRVVSKLTTFSKEQIKMIGVKVKTLEIVQERLTKISKGPGFLSKLFWKEKSPSPVIEEEKVRLAGQLGRLRADLFLTFIEIFQEIKPTLVSAKEVFKRGLFKNVTVFDKIMEPLDNLIKQGNGIGEKLLRASDGYGKRDAIDTINKEVEILIGNYIKSAIKVMTLLQPAAVAFKGMINVIRPLTWVIQTVTVGGITSFMVVFELIDKIVSAGKIAADLSKDIFDKVIEKDGIKSVETKLSSTEKEVVTTSKKIEATDSNNEEDVLDLGALRPKSN